MFVLVHVSSVIYILILLFPQAIPRVSLAHFTDDQLRQYIDILAKSPASMRTLSFHAPVVFEHDMLLQSPLIRSEKVILDDVIIFTTHAPTKFWQIRHVAAISADSLSAGLGY